MKLMSRLSARYFSLAFVSFQRIFDNQFLLQVAVSNLQHFFRRYSAIRLISYLALKLFYIAESFIKLVS